MNKNVLVTGATGFIGHHLCNRLHEDGYKVFALGRKDENKIKCHEFYTSSLKNISWRDIPKIDICFHLAAEDGRFGTKESQIIETNFHDSTNLFKRLADSGCKKFVYSSCCSIYGNQSPPFKEDSSSLEFINTYSKSKYDFENFAKSFASRTKSVCVGLRYTNVYGTYEFYKRSKASFIIQVIKKLSKNESPLIFRDGEQLRDYVYISDVVDANILASKYNSSEIFNIGSGDVASFNAIFSLISKRMKKTLKPTYVDCPNEQLCKNATVSLIKSETKLGYYPKYRIEDGIQNLKIMLGKLFN